MQEYSLVLGMHTWLAVNLSTGKVLSGEYKDLPSNISKGLKKLVKPSTNKVCISATVKLSPLNPFHLWFEKQPILAYEPL